MAILAYSNVSATRAGGVAPMRPRRRALASALMVIGGLACTSQRTAPASGIPAGMTAVLIAPETVHVGGSMLIELVMINTNRDSVRINLGAGDESLTASADLLDGREVWNLAEGRILPPVGTSFIMPPQGTDTFRTTWTLANNDSVRLPPGQYLLRAGIAFLPDTLFARNAPLRFTIAP